jgi:hypothetical protein
MTELTDPITRLPISEEMALRTWIADCWTCRYCCELVFFPPAFRAMARRFGNHGYWHPNWKADHSPLLIRRGASVDHVVAVTRGGAHDDANFVTACWECNLRKGDQDGWVPKPRPTSGVWDGMLAVFVGLAITEPDAAERCWLKTIEAVGV